MTAAIDCEKCKKEKQYLKHPCQTRQYMIQVGYANRLLIAEQSECVQAFWNRQTGENHAPQQH